MIGGTGNDVLRGGPGEDSFVFKQFETSANPDVIKDFQLGLDQLVLDRGSFSAFGADPAGALAPSTFTLGRAATTADQHLIYNKATGVLFYDADGVGGIAQVALAIFDAKPILSVGDFLLL